MRTQMVMDAIPGEGLNVGQEKKPDPTKTFSLMRKGMARERRARSNEAVQCRVFLASFWVLLSVRLSLYWISE